MRFGDIAATYLLSTFILMHFCVFPVTKVRAEQIPCQTVDKSEKAATKFADCVFHLAIKALETGSESDDIRLATQLMSDASIRSTLPHPAYDNMSADQKRIYKSIIAKRLVDQLQRNVSRPRKAKQKVTSSRLAGRFFKVDALIKIRGYDPFSIVYMISFESGTVKIVDIIFDRMSFRSLTRSSMYDKIGKSQYNKNDLQKFLKSLE